jgi:hypothetical protein
MNKDDLGEFQKIMDVFLSSWKGVTVNRDLHRKWWKAFEVVPELSVDMLQKALIIYNLRTDNKYNTPPTPGAIIEIIIGNNESRAVEAWNNLMFILENIGANINVDLGDTVANYTFNELGGFGKASNWTDESLPYLKKEFISLYSSNVTKFIYNKDLSTYDFYIKGLSKDKDNDNFVLSLGRSKVLKIGKTINNNSRDIEVV